jgi:hypothetical protein
MHISKGMVPMYLLECKINFCYFLQILQNGVIRGLRKLYLSVLSVGIVRSRTQTMEFSLV